MMNPRKATKKDIRGMAKLMLEEFSKPPFNEKAPISSVIRSLNFYFKIGKAFVAVENRRIVGVVVFKVEQWWEGPVILIEDLAVKEDFKKQGIGEKLTDAVERHGKNIKAKAVSFATNSKSSAVRFYARQGYKIEKNRVFMRKRIKL